MRPVSAAALSTASLLVASVVVVAACESDGAGKSSKSGSTSGSNGSSSGGAGGSSSSGMPSGTAAGGNGSGGSGTGAGSSGSGTAYQNPEIIGGACDPAATPASPPCDDGEPDQLYCRLDDATDAIMATCSTFGIAQCEVMDDCAPGWHACTASDYVARGGRDVAPDLASATNRAWLAACVQDLGGGAQLRDEPCSFCGDTEYVPIEQWWCEDGTSVSPGGMAGTTLGVLAAPECMRVGANVPGHGAHWNMAFTTDYPGYVVCCLDAL